MFNTNWPRSRESYAWPEGSFPALYSAIHYATVTQFVDMPDSEPAERIFPHTLVKDEYAGQGLASILVREALDQTV